MSGFTKGPWHFEQDAPDWPGIVVWGTRSGPDDKHIVAVPRFGDKETNAANARLIAAAPDMYEALKIAAPVLALLIDPTNKTPSNVAYAQVREAELAVRAALAKAEGRE